MANKLWLALAILVQGCGGFLAVAQERIDKPFTVGQLGFIEHTEPCEWLTRWRHGASSMDVIQNEDIEVF